jgi:hypothetical protein
MKVISDFEDYTIYSHCTWVLGMALMRSLGLGLQGLGLWLKGLGLKIWGARPQTSLGGAE